MVLIKGLFSILWLVITIGALYNIWKGDSQTSMHKVLWTVGILVFPFLGPLAWILFGERASK